MRANGRPGAFKRCTNVARFFRIVCLEVEDLYRTRQEFCDAA
jgi:hypothetical protein